MAAKKLSIVAGFVNIFGILIFSLGLTNPYITKFSPAVFSSFGLLCIILWGLAYIAAGCGEVNWRIYAVFVLEKLLYFLTWWYWMTEYGLQLGPVVYQESFITGIFYTVYGPLDLLFAICFVVIAYRAMLKSH